MKRIYITTFTLFTFFTSQAWNENNPIGSRSSGMGNASVSFGDVWSAHHNQAGLGFVRDISAGAYYENRFLLKEISVKGGVVALPIKAGTFGLTISNFGYSLYNENKYSLSFAKTFGDKLSFGLAMDYLTTKIAEGYGNKGVLAGEFGIQAKPLKGLTIRRAAESKLYLILLVQKLQITMMNVCQPSFVLVAIIIFLIKLQLLLKQKKTLHKKQFLKQE